MRFFILIIFILLMSCDKKEIDNKINNNYINQNFPFGELKNLIEKKALTKDYPNINK